MKLRHPFLLQTAGLLGAAIVRSLTGSLTIRKEDGPSGPHPANPRERRFIYALWHDSMLLATAFQTRIHVLVSQHADGELISQVVRHFRIGLVRGSSRRGGTAALLRLLQLSRESHLCITPDGPRGPRRQVQPGVVFLASHTGLPIVPIGVGLSHAWRARSWDRFAVPLPFSTACCVGGEALRVPAGLDPAGLEHYRIRLEERMRAACGRAERWAAGLPRGGEEAATVALARSA